jgi:hypothetical protein
MKNIIFRYPQSVAIACIVLSVCSTLWVYQLLRPKHLPTVIETVRIAQPQEAIAKQ